MTILLENGADCKLSTHLGDTPVSLAMSKGYTNIVSVIEGGHKVNTGMKHDHGKCVYY